MIYFTFITSRGGAAAIVAPRPAQLTQQQEGSKSSSRRCKEGIEREGGLEKRAEPPRQLWRWKKREEGDLGDEKWPQLSQKKKRRRKISMMMMERV